LQDYIMNEESKPEENAKRCMMDAGAQVARTLGQKDAIGALRAIMFLAEDPISMDELEKETGYSKTSVSTNMTFLEDRGVVRIVRKPGDKKNYYVSLADIDEIISQESDNIKRIIQTYLTAVEQANTHLEEAKPGEEVDRLRRRLAYIKESSINIQKYVHLMNEFTIEEHIEILERELKKQNSIKK